MSIGYAWSEGKDRICSRNLLKEADENMYREKMRRRSGEHALPELKHS